jgi:hypothetical protein
MPPAIVGYASTRELHAEAILFWDDQEANVAAARERGWRAELYGGVAEFETALERLRPWLVS